MRRVVVTGLFLVAGLFTSWISMLFASWLAVRFAWPLIDTSWHPCWDAERCQVSWLGDAMVVASIIGPALVWAVVGFWLAKELLPLQLSRRIVPMAIATLAFYLVLHAAVWP
jgi:hypothetical protein